MAATKTKKKKASPTPGAKKTTKKQASTTPGAKKTTKKQASTTPGAKKTTKKTATVAPAKGASASVQLSALLALLAGVAPLADVQRKAFRGRYDEAQCLANGAQTKAEVVLNEAIGWSKTIQAALPKLGAAAPYSPARFAWLLECARDLALEIQGDDERLGSVRGAQSAGEKARAEAMSVRKGLAAKLAVIVGGVAAEVDELDAARGTADDASAIVRSLGALAKLAGAWLSSKDAGDQALVASANLRQGDVDTALRAAGALKDAASGALGSRGSPKDSTTTNVAEGRLLFEMKLVHGIFDDAHASTPDVPRLPLGAATRRVIGGRPKKPETTAPPTPAPSPATGK